MVNGSNWRSVCNQWHNSRRMALSPGCRFCTHYGWNGYKPSSCNILHKRGGETPRHVEAVRVLVVGATLCHFKNVFMYLHILLACSFRWNKSTGKRYHIHALYWTTSKTTYGLEVCAQESVCGILRQQQWHCHLRSPTRTAYQHIRHCEYVLRFVQHSYNVISTDTSANWRFTPIHMFHTVAQNGEREGQYWAPNPNCCTLK